MKIQKHLFFCDTPAIFPLFLVAHLPFLIFDIRKKRLQGQVFKKMCNTNWVQARFSKVWPIRRFRSMELVSS